MTYARRVNVEPVSPIQPTLRFAASRAALDAADGMSLLTAMLRSTRDHVAIKDPHGQYLFVNPAAAEWFGRPVEMIVGRTNADLMGEAQCAAIMVQDRALLVDGKPMEYEEYLTTDGVTRTWLTTKDVMRDASGRVIAYASISREITERVAAQQALARSDEALQQSLRLLNSVLDRTTDHMNIRGVDGRFLMVNQACAEWYGYPAEAMIGLTCDELMAPAEAAIVRERDTLMLATGARMNYEEVLLHEGRARIWLSTRDVIRDESGQIVAHFVISREITELRQAEAQAQQSQKMESIGRLAGGIAHDFNNLLTVISGNAQMLIADLGDHPGQEAAREIASAADRAASVTRQLLAFSRQQVLAPELLDVQSVVDDIDPLIRRLVGENVRIRTRFGTSLGLVQVDRNQLEQALLNLVINARDAMPDGGTLTISTANIQIGQADALTHVGIAAGPYVELTLADTGVGMTPAVRDRIFEPFYTTKGPGKGTGLGLSMVEGLVHQSGGDISVDSEPGVGTTFRILFPQLPGVPAPRRPDVPAARGPGGHEVILLVEDEPGVREIARRFLVGAGYTVLDAPDPAAANSIIDERAADIDLLLTDVLMPGGTGPDVGRTLGSVNSRAAILYMSGYTDDAISHQGVLEPGVKLIEKPFSAATLLAAVRASLRTVVSGQP